MLVASTHFRFEQFLGAICVKSHIHRCYDEHFEFFMQKCCSIRLVVWAICMTEQNMEKDVSCGWDYKATLVTFVFLLSSFCISVLKFLQNISPFIYSGVLVTSIQFSLFHLLLFSFLFLIRKKNLLKVMFTSWKLILTYLLFQKILLFPIPLLSCHFSRRIWWKFVIIQWIINSMNC